MRIRISLENTTMNSLLKRLHQAYAVGNLRLTRRIHALLFIVDEKTVAQVAEIVNLSEQTVRNYVKAFILKGLSSLTYQRPPGRPPKLTKTQRSWPS